MSEIIPLFANTLKPLATSAGEKLPDPNAKLRSWGNLSTSKPKLSTVSDDFFMPTSLKSFIETIFIDWTSASLRVVKP